MPNPSRTRRVKGVFRHTLDQLLLVDLIRYALVAVRFFWFVKVKCRLATYALNDNIGEHTVSHNLKGLRDLAVNRSHLLIRPLSVIETLAVDARVLSIGPRTEGELFSLAAYGFVWRNITGLDLISYSPRVKLGDMHATGFEAGSFDAVILGWVIAYSDNPYKAAAEVVRITVNGGIIAVGVEYSPKTQEEIVSEHGYLPGAKHRTGSCAEILEYFGDAVDHVYYNHVVAPENAAAVGALCVIFSIRK